MGTGLQRVKGLSPPLPRGSAAAQGGYLLPMLTWRMFLTFLAVVLSVMGGVHAYLYLRLVAATDIPSPWQGWLGGLLVLVVLSIPLSFLASRILDRNVARYVVVPVYVWLGFAFQTFFLLVLVDGVRGIFWLLGALLGLDLWLQDPGGASGLWPWVAAGIVGTTLASTIFAIWWGLTRLKIRRVEVELPRLPAALDGFTIAHLSDLHLDLIHGREWLASVVEKTNALAPDLVAITGDLAEGSVAQFGPDVTPLRKLSASHGVFFVTGNHEYFHDLDGWLKRLPQLGVRVLRNERVAIHWNGGSFDLVGVDDHEGARIRAGHGPDLDRALEGRDPGRAAVLLSHQPRIMQDADEHGVDLVLSGHTHGGQIWPFSYLVYLQQPYVKGLKRRGNTLLYLSSGTGFWGPPMRLGTTAEIALVTLRAPGDSPGSPQGSADRTSPTP